MRRCPLCDQEALTFHKELYWHRMHQVPGIDLCPRHGALLVAGNVLRHDPSTRNEFVPAEFLPVGVPDLCSSAFTPTITQLLLRLGRGVAWLLQENRKWGCAAQVRALYRRLLIERGLISGGGSVRWERMLDEFRSRYPTETLRLLQSTTDQDGKRILWLERLLRSKPSAQSPVRHLLLMDFLGYDAKQFFGLMEQENKTMFGEHGWPCLNPVCTQSGNYCIENFRLKRGCCSPVRPVGLFRCDTCGFTYARYGPDQDRVRITQIDWVVDYGEHWDSTLHAMWNDSKLSLRAIARRLRVDPVTIKRLVKKLGLDPFAKSRLGPAFIEHRIVRDACLVTDGQATRVTRNTRREEWRAALQTGLYKTRTEARHAHPSLYAWLYRHDRTWLKQQSLLNQNATSRDVAYHRSNAVWMRRDLEASAEVPAVANLLKNAPGKLRRVSAAAIARQLGVRVNTQKHPKKMPRTVQMLQQYAEDRLAFAERRLMWAADKFVSLNARIPRWRLIRIAGLRPEIVQSGKITHMLDILSGSHDYGPALKVGNMDGG